MMKAILKHCNVFIFFALLTVQAFAKADPEPIVEKKKNYTKTVAVTGSDRIRIENKFGELRFQTWNRNEVKVDVTITAKSSDDERAQEILDNITISDGKSGGEVWFKTNMSDNHRMRKKSDYREEGFTINYMVSLPAGNPLISKNEFGQTIMPDYNGEVSIESKFGGLTAGNLNNVKTINVEFGKAEIKKIQDGKLTVKFSRALVGDIVGNLDASFEHCGGVKLGIGNNAKSLNIKNDFTKMYLEVEKTVSADFDFRTHFGDVNNKTEFNIKKDDQDDDDHGPRFDHRYRGKAGSGTNSIEVRSNFGEIVVGHDLQFNINEEEKGKNKVRNKEI